MMENVMHEYIHEWDAGPKPSMDQLKLKMNNEAPNVGMYINQHSYGHQKDTSGIVSVKCYLI